MNAKATRLYTASYRVCVTIYQIDSTGTSSILSSLRLRCQFAKSSNLFVIPLQNCISMLRGKVHAVIVFTIPYHIVSDMLNVLQRIYCPHSLCIGYKFCTAPTRYMEYLTFNDYDYIHPTCFGKAYHL